MSRSGSLLLTLSILGGLLLALVLAIAAPGVAVLFKPLGQLFLDLLTMIVVPLVILSVMTGVLQLDDVRRLARPGGATVAYYFSTTMIAIVLGLVVVNLIEPGVMTTPGSVDVAQTAGEEAPSEDMDIVDMARQSDQGVMDLVRNMLDTLFTDNLLRAAVEVQLLPLIIFAIVFALVVASMGERTATLSQVIVEANDAMMHLVSLIMLLSPLGIFCLVAGTFGQKQLDGNLVSTFMKVSGYAACVLIGLAVHAVVVLPTIYYLLTRRNPFVYMIRVSQAVLMAFSTASSTATLPVTLRCVTEDAGVSERSARFVLPLGATINMDGTALYEAVAAIFIAQLAGVELGIMGNITVALTATLASVGAAGIPHAGLVTMVIVLNAVGLDTQYMALILPVDWLLDRFRTAVNVGGDSIGAAVVAPLFAGDDEPTAATPASPS